MWCCFPQSQDPQVQDSRLGTGVVAHSVTLSEPLATVLRLFRRSKGFRHRTHNDFTEQEVNTATWPLAFLTPQN